jgi:hypothetical protein
MKLHIIAAALLIAVGVAAQTAGPIEQQAPQAATNAIEQGVAPAEAPAAVTPPPIDAKRALRDLRVAKCRMIVERLYPRSGFGPYVEFFIDEHERLGMGAEWWWSLVYGGANFSLRVGARAPGNCAGPMDVKHYPLVLDPKANIRWHCREMAGFYGRGVRGIRLCYSVFLPANPRDWGGGRFKRTHRKHLQCIEAAYKRGDLP